MSDERKGLASPGERKVDSLLPAARALVVAMRSHSTNLRHEWVMGGERESGNATRV